ncbi:MAG: hypothetical protein ACHP7N_00450 [Caulobacterales bacterium]
MKRPALLAAFALLAALTLWAPAAAMVSADLNCTNGYFPTDQGGLGLAKVIDGPRVYLLQCPDEAPDCRQKAYVVPGDIVLVGRESGDYMCVLMPNRFGGSAGWVRHDRLTLTPTPPAPPLSSWAGDWANGDDTLKATILAQALKVDGDACWPSCHVSIRERPGGPNVGEIHGSAAPKSNDLVIIDGDGPEACRADLKLVGPYLVVSDNNACGGMNVSFSGIYQRKARR